jgi:hypothetical protein
MAAEVREQGFTDSYGHADLDGPCTCAECCPDVENGYVPTCGICRCRLVSYGLCVECMTKPEGIAYMETH